MVEHDLFRKPVSTFRDHAPTIWLRDLLQPSLRIPRIAAARRQRAHQFRHGLEIVDRPQLVDMRHDRPDALGLGFETRESQQRIEPDQPPAGPVQPVDLEGEAVVGIALEPVSDEQHDGALRKDAARPQLVEGMERGRDTRAARPVRDIAGDCGQRLVRILRLERAGDIGETGAEQERVHALARIGDGVEKVQEEPRVLAHRSGNIEQRHDRRRLGAGPEILQVDNRTAGLEARAQGATDVDDVSMAVRCKPPRLDLIEREHQPLNRVLRGQDLGRGHLREVLLLQDLAIGDGQARIDLDLRRLAIGLALPRQQRLLHALGTGRRLLVLARGRLRQHRGE